jgi:predicted acyltransferase
MSTASASAPAPSPIRIAAIDAYRGLVMFLMIAEVLNFARVANGLHSVADGKDAMQSVAEAFPIPPLSATISALPDSSPRARAVWDFCKLHQTHVEWGGCTLHDLIQPSFSFLVGVALPFSLLSRSARGQSFAVRALHALWRAVALTFLGVFLRSVGQSQTNFTFTDTLSQIGMGYFFLFLLGHVRQRWQWLALAVILVGYWAWFAAYTPPSDLDAKTTGVRADWPYHPQGFAAHWDKNNNPAAAFDRWFLNLFPQARPFTNNGGGYATLSFIPTLGTMILGLIAGTWLLRPASPGMKTLWMVAAGLVLLGAGWGLDQAGVCPSVKRIWTPSWVLFSGGWCFLILAGFYVVTDWVGFAGWAYPLRVIGANSIVAYCMAWLIEPFVIGSFKTHLGKDVFKAFGPQYEPFVTGVAVLAVFWLILFWLYRRNIFVRICV